MFYTKENAEDFFAEFLASDLGARMEHAGLLTNSNTRLLVVESKEKFGDMFSVLDFASVAKRVYWAYLNNELESDEPTPTPEPVKQLTASQKAWQECRLYTESHSTKECELRARTDSVYAAYLHKLRVGEFEGSQAQVGDAVVNLNKKKPLAKGKIPADVVQFAEDYKHMSVAQVKSLLSPAASGEVAAKHYQKLFDAACNVGLI